MAAEDSFDLEFAFNKLKLDENENSSLLNLSATDNGVVENNSSVNPVSVSTLKDTSLNKNDTAELPVGNVTQSPLKNDSSSNANQLENGVSNNIFFESVNNNSSDIVHENEQMPSNLSGLKENSLSNVNNDKVTSFESHILDETSSPLKLNDNLNGSSFNCSALSDKIDFGTVPVAKLEDSAALSDKSQVDEFPVPNPAIDKLDKNTSSDEKQILPEAVCSSVLSDKVDIRAEPVPQVEESDIFSEGNQFQEFAFPEPVKLINMPDRKMSGDGKLIVPDVDPNDGEEFQDAVQFFKDPSSIQFLENIKTSETKQQQSFMPRDSLYVKFDPLHSSVNLQTVISQQVSNATMEVQSDEIVEVSEKTTEDIISVGNPDCNTPTNMVNKRLGNVCARQSFGNILLSFDSPMKSNSARVSEHSADSPFKEPPRLFTEEELQQALKNHELSIQEVFLKQQKEMEEGKMKIIEEKMRIIEEKDKSITNLSGLIRSMENVISELFNVSNSLKQNNTAMISQIEGLEAEKKKLEGEVKTTSDDLQSVETTFSDFHKRYEHCKEMLKTYKSNEDCLKEQIETLNKKIAEQEQMYNMLQAKTEEVVEKANFEVTNARKGGDAQLAVLKAQLKKSELKVCSLESDLKQVRIENDKLSSICDDLMAKVSGS